MSTPRALNRWHPLKNVWLRYVGVLFLVAFLPLAIAIAIRVRDQEDGQK